LLVGSGLLVGSCGGSEEEKIQAAKLAEKCALNSQCENPLVCTFERCHKECDEDRDCPGEQRCVGSPTGNICQLDVETNCASNSSACQGDQVCGVDKECRDPCQKDGDCTTGQVCANQGQCASRQAGKDVVDEDGNILPDNFGGSGGTGGAGGSGGNDASAGTGGTGGNDGGAGKGGSAGTGGIGGTAGSAGTGGTAGGDGGAQCPAGFGECDEDPSTVCEQNLALTTSCGGCTTVCNGTNGRVKCDTAEYKCVIDEPAGGCNDGFDNCDSNAVTGCEANLTNDPKNCGRCGKDCGAGLCIAGQCQPEIVLDPPETTSYSYVEGFLVGNTVYAAIDRNGTNPWTMRKKLVSDPAGPGTIVHALASTSATVGAVAVDATNFYFFTTANPPTLFKKALTAAQATAQQEVFTLPSGLYLYQHVLSPFGTAVYFPAYTSTYGLYSGAKAGGVAPSLITGLGGRQQIYSIVATSTRLFWVEYTAGKYRLLTAPLSGIAGDAGTPTELDGDVGGGSDLTLAADSTHVYWSTYQANGKVRRVPIATASPIDDVATGIPNPSNGLALDQEYVYFRDSSHTLYRAKKNERVQPEVVTDMYKSPGYATMYGIFGVDAQSVYGIGATGEIVRVTKTP
jgi:hypothetical protein